MRRRRTQAGGGDLHARFAAWLQRGEAVDPARDVAVHAAHCVGCRAAMLALDHLLLVDLGRASLPPPRSVASERPGGLGRHRTLAAATAAILVAAATVWIGVGALAPGSSGDVVAEPSTDQDVLGGLGEGPSLTPTMPPPSFGAMASESSSASPAAAPSSASGTVDPTSPAPVTARPVPSSLPPSASQPASRTAVPSRTPAPTATPSPESTPTQDASPVLDDCENGIDDDGDTFVDGDDPGCMLDGDEASA